MAISFTNQISFLFKNKIKIKQWIKDIVTREDKKLGEISYIFCDDNKILEVNKQYLSHDYFTDIITFDYVEKDIISGDIIISIDRVKENSKSFNSSFEDELHRVIIHGVLHLIGYNDKTDKEQQIMREKENECLLILKEKYV
ncbi:MAG: rRNA maturation RNase YbeY [Bacteroidales bacterium]|jgi:probable rRNA maturation factor|nr:rRNA maturation RNase YbeY [Bacteroidales bacterium]